LSFGDQVAVRNAQRTQVVAAYAAFAIGGIVAIASGGDYHRIQASAEKLESMVEAGTKNWRGAAGVLRRSKNHDGSGWQSFIGAGLAKYADAGKSEPAGDDYDDDRGGNS
jgi:hypothetical protein